jgi:hypothetical protein
MSQQKNLTFQKRHPRLAGFKMLLLGLGIYVVQTIILYVQFATKSTMSIFFIWFLVAGGFMIYAGGLSIIFGELFTSKDKKLTALQRVLQLLLLLVGLAFSVGIALIFQYTSMYVFQLKAL